MKNGRTITQLLICRHKGEPLIGQIKREKDRRDYSDSGGMGERRSPSEARPARRIARDIFNVRRARRCVRDSVASAPNYSPIERKLKHGAQLDMCPLSGADGACASPPHAHNLRTYLENASDLRLVGGAQSIRTLGRLLIGPNTGSASGRSAERNGIEPPRARSHSSQCKVFTS